VFACVYMGGGGEGGVRVGERYREKLKGIERN
jgi:hypothetical protein